MSELILLLLRIGFLLVMWFFVFGVVYSLRADLFGVKVRKLPSGGHGGAAAARRRPREARGPRGRVLRNPRRTRHDRAAKRLVITSGPKAGLELPSAPTR